MLVSILALVCVSFSARVYTQYHVFEGDAPFHQSIPDSQENDPDSSEDNVADDENDWVIVEASIILWSPSIRKQNSSMVVDIHLEHPPAIPAPPPKS